MTQEQQLFIATPPLKQFCLTNNLTAVFNYYHGQKT